MSHSPNPKSPNQNPNESDDSQSSSTLRRSITTLTKHEAINRFILNMKLNSISPPPQDDAFTAVPDEFLLRVFSKLPRSQLVSNSLVCKRWLILSGSLVNSLRVFDFGFIQSGRVFHRFPSLIDVDVVHACVKSPRNVGIIASNGGFSVSVFTDSRMEKFGFLDKEGILPVDVVNLGVRLIAEGYVNLSRFVGIGVGESGLRSVAQECETLQELELHCCDDMSLKGISGCRNLQIVKLVGSLDGFYESVVSDIGLTLLAHGCGRLVKLELCGCEGSYDGIKAIGQCCQMLEELTICDHRMDEGWLSALSFCGNLKTLRLKCCKVLDSDPGLDEHLGSCPTLEELHLKQCQMKDRAAVRALFSVCEAVKEIALEDCWGLENDIFSCVGICRSVRFLSLEGCSLLTVIGLELVIFSLQELQMLRVESCKSIKDEDITPALTSLFSALKELKWRPDSESLLVSSLEETGIGKKGDRFFKS